VLTAPVEDHRHYAPQSFDWVALVAANSALTALVTTRWLHARIPGRLAAAYSFSELDFSRPIARTAWERELGTGTRQFPPCRSCETRGITRSVRRPICHPSFMIMRTQGESLNVGQPARLPRMIGGRTGAPVRAPSHVLTWTTTLSTGHHHNDGPAGKKRHSLAAWITPAG